MAQTRLGQILLEGQLTTQDIEGAKKWFRIAADAGDLDAQAELGFVYFRGDAGERNLDAAREWCALAADRGHERAQGLLAVMYYTGEGVPKDYVRAYAWANLAAAKGDKAPASLRELVAEEMTPEQIAEGQRVSAEFIPKGGQRGAEELPQLGLGQSVVCGSGFFITSDGFFITNHHVIQGARRISIRTALGAVIAVVIAEDAANDLAILKAVGTFPCLSVRGSSGLRIADRVSTVGFPNPELQGLVAKQAGGDIAALSGPGDDPRLLQISVPTQPGNSGGPLVDSSGCVVGVVVAQLDKIQTLKLTGHLPENVNYAIKGTILMSVLESVPGLMEKLRPEPAARERDPADVAQEVQAACGMVLVER